MKLKTGFKFYIKGSAEIYLIFLFAWLFSAPVCAQYKKFECFTIDQGLSQATINCIHQDTYGYLWLGTQDGLNRFDGYKFSVLKHDPAGNNTISDNCIQTVYEDNFGILWIGTESGGLNKYNRFTGEIQPFTSDPKDPHSICSNNIISIASDNSGKLYIGTDNGLSVMDIKRGRFENYCRHLPGGHRLPDNQIYKVFADSKKKIWIGTQRGLSQYDPAKKIISDFRSINNSKLLDNIQVYDIREDGAGNLWIATADRGVVYLDRKNGGVVSFRHNRLNDNSLSDDGVQSLCIDRKGRLWIGTFSSGVDRYDPHSGRFIHLKNDPYDPFTLPDNDVISLFEDRSGLIWIGTAAGLCKYDESKEVFRHIRRNIRDSNSLPDNMVSALCEDKSGYIWCGTAWGGLSRYNKKDGTIKNYQHRPGKNSISHNRIGYIYCDRDNILWIAAGNGLDRFDPATEKFTRYKNNPRDKNSIHASDIMYIMEDRNGKMYLASQQGLSVFDKKTGKAHHFIHSSDDNLSISDESLLCLHEDSEGLLWIGTWGLGLDVYNPRTRRFTHYRYNKKDNNSLPHDIVMSISEDPLGRKNIIWIGTSGGGLAMFNKATGKFQRYTENSGLANNLVYGILPGSSGELWISTNRGLSRMNVSNGSFRNYDVSDGLQSNEFSQSAYAKTASGEMVFGGINGFNIFDPSRIEINKFIPPVVITSFRVFNKELPASRFSEKTDEVVLSYKDYVFSIEFASLDLSSPHRNRYKYMLEGVDQGWTDAGSQRVITYTNLTPGEYVFRVIASNSDGLWNETGRSIRILVVPPVWRTNWFRILSILVLAGIGLYLVRIRIRNIEQQRNLLEQQVTERTRELQNEIVQRKMTEKALRDSENILKIMNDNKDKFFSIISHDLKSPFTSIAGFSNLLSRELDNMDKKDIKEAVYTMNVSIKSVYNLIDNLLTWSRAQMKRIDCKREIISLFEVSDEVINYLQVNFLSKDITLINSIQKDRQVYADRNMLSSVLQNLISNAIKFTPAGGCIKLTSREKDGFSEIDISDTGVGMEPEELDKLFRIEYSHTTPGTNNEKGSGLGLILCKELIEIQGGCISVSSCKSRGTTFTFTLPLTSNND
ncbi:MAG: two-component regulator propeller domain-containing protein [Bacteroidota bacterium]